MSNTNNCYRIRTKIGDNSPSVISVPFKQTYDMFDILSLKINQKNIYKTYESTYGVVVGRVIANGGFGVPNAKLSIFIKVDPNESVKNRLIYNYNITNDGNIDGVRYNVLPDDVDNACHQNIGTFPNKRLVLDNNNVLEIFDKYWKYTTTTNHAGDYMFYGIPVGNQTLHMDLDLSDCGVLSQRPRDMMMNGYSKNMFDNPNKFKRSKTLDSLAQVITQEKSIYVYPYWGDTSENDENLLITRCDIKVNYKFESYAVFMGSVITDRGSNGIGKNCTATTDTGKMSDMITGEGTIEMIRKTIDDKVEQFTVNGGRLIDGDGVWCYQIPMNLDYVTTDEFGNTVPTDDPKRGIATRTRIRFRFTIDEDPNDVQAHKRARYLVPNNPRMNEGDFDNFKDADYEFGSLTREESFKDLLWNKVYTVKNYVPIMQKNNRAAYKKRTGFKWINHYGDNNPLPYNNMSIQISFVVWFLCMLSKLLIDIYTFINQIISTISVVGGMIIKLGRTIYKPFEKLGWIGRILGAPFKIIGKSIESIGGILAHECIPLSGDFCSDETNPIEVYPGCGQFIGGFKIPKFMEYSYKETVRNKTKEGIMIQTSIAMINNCIENQLIQSHSSTSFEFGNDWVNGVLYAPMWYRYIRPKRYFFFGLFKRRAKDDWCSSEKNFDKGIRLTQFCATPRTPVNNSSYTNFSGDKVLPYNVSKDACDKKKCHKNMSNMYVKNGLIIKKETMLGQNVYYYRSIEYDNEMTDNKKYTHSKINGEIKLLFATDIVLLGSLLENDIHGVPQFFKTLTPTSFKIPTDVLFTDYDFELTIDKHGRQVRRQRGDEMPVRTSQMAGCDWGNPNEFDKHDGGLFYNVGCTSKSIEVATKSCINLSRICEYGVSLDETKYVPNLKQLSKFYPSNNSPSRTEAESGYAYSDDGFDELITDGFISYDELYNIDERAMFATMNSNNLMVKYDTKTNMYEYDFRYLYPENFDGSLYTTMKKTTEKYDIRKINYANNYKLERFSRDYYIFRMGDKPYYYDSVTRNNQPTKTYAFPRYENSFYFYFGLKAGKTALEKFNTKYFANCSDENEVLTQIGMDIQENTWCSQLKMEGNSENKNKLDGYVAFDLSKISAPYDLTINSTTNLYNKTFTNISKEKIIFTTLPKPKKFEDYFVIDEMILNGYYDATIVDNDGSMITFNFDVKENYLTFDYNIQPFKQPNNILDSKYGNVSESEKYKLIASDKDGINTSEINYIKRDIGGVITIYNIAWNDRQIDDYKITIRPVDELKGYKGVSVNKNDQENQSISFIMKGHNKHGNVFVFGVPYGGIRYSINITELCNNFESQNSVTRIVRVNEPEPYKMYINDIDYDLIKTFNNDRTTTGWNLNNGNPIIKGFGSNLQTSDINVLTNPWFNIENIYSNMDLFRDCVSIEGTNSDNLVIVNNQGFKRSVTYEQIIDEFTKQDNNVPYNWIDGYILTNHTTKEKTDYEQFSKEVTEIITNRRNLLEKMQSTFIMYCQDDPKDIRILGVTDDMPCIPTIVYHAETATETSDVNILINRNMSLTNNSIINDIQIPTITYKHSMFNDNVKNLDDNDYSVTITELNRIKKKPYFTGIINASNVTIPYGLNYRKNPQTKNNIISEDNLLRNLFSFPIIDKIMRDEIICWTSMFNIPKYGRKYHGEIVHSNGLLTGHIFNGKINGNRFITQKLNGMSFNITNNLLAKDSKTYIEKRFIMNFNYNDLLNYFKINYQKYANLISMEDLFNKFGIHIDKDEMSIVINDLYIDIFNNLVITYKGTVLKLNVEKEILPYLVNFTNYTIYDESKYGKSQYLILFPLGNNLVIEDKSGCGINKIINGHNRLILSDDSIHDNQSKNVVINATLEIPQDNVVYSICSVDYNGDGYPINEFIKNPITKVDQITQKVSGKYTKNESQNIFSPFMKTDDLMFGDFLQKDFISEYMDEFGKTRTTYGYSKTGQFKQKKKKHPITKPFFIVAETSDHIRTISPVFEFIYLKTRLKLLSIQDDTEGVSMTDYKLQISLNDKDDGAYGKDGSYYYRNHPYRLMAHITCDKNLNETNTPNIVNFDGTFIGVDKNIFIDFEEEDFNKLKERLGLARHTRNINYQDCWIDTIDAVGLKTRTEQQWLDKRVHDAYAIKFILNVPSNNNFNQPVIEVSHIIDEEYRYVSEYKDYKEINEDIVAPDVIRTDDFEYRFLGWSDQPTASSGRFGVLGKTNGSVKYYGIWVKK